MEQKYHLYAVQPQDIPDDERFFLITPGYTYLYTQNQPPEGGVEVTDVQGLSPLAKDWLQRQISTVRAEYIAGNGTDVLKQAHDLTAAFKRELAKENRKLARKKAHWWEGLF